MIISYRHGLTAGFTWVATAALLLILELLITLGLSLAQVPTYKERTLYSFTGGADGKNPHANLISDAKGNFHSTTVFGGASNAGTVFELSPTGEEKVLYSFTGGEDGAQPYAGLIADANGNFYGTTIYGGKYNDGVVFKVSPTGKEKVLHNFTGKADGNWPSTNLIADAKGNLYGTAPRGGNYGSGVVYSVSPTGKFKVLYSFTGGPDGGSPYGSLTWDAKGNLYGTTLGGGKTYGVVYKVSPTGKEKVLYTFTGGSDGANPESNVVFDGRGNLYGTASFGGQGASGVVFRLSPTGKEKVLYTFTGGSDGANPSSNLIFDAKGNLYGTAESGGENNNGVVFKIPTRGGEIALYLFTGGSDGTDPVGALLFDAKGSLYGTARNGGTQGTGTVYKLIP